MDGDRAVRLAAQALGVAPVVPPGGALGELAVEFRWMSQHATWVTNGSRHLIVVGLELPFSVILGSHDVGTSGGGDAAVSARQFPDRALPNAWLKSPRARRWVQRLALSPSDSVIIDGTAVAFEFPVSQPEPDLRRGMNFLESLQDLADDEAPSNGRLGADVESRTGTKPRGQEAPPIDRFVSPRLRNAMTTYRSFVLSDDEARERSMAEAPSDKVRALAEEVKPLLTEIDQLLDRFQQLPYPRSSADDALETDLSSLAQAGIEAWQELDRRDS